MWSATVYKAYLEKYPLDNIYISKLKSHIEVTIPNNPLYFPNVEEFGYSVVEVKEYQDLQLIPIRKKIAFCYLFLSYLRFPFSSYLLTSISFP